MIDTLLALWPIITFAIGVIVWFMRMEAKGMSNAKEIKRLWAVRDEDQRRIDQHTEDTNRKLDRISTDVRDLGKTLTADIKHILEEMK